nr:MAG TPA: hypothetical protein [Caudoviricetes sp.]
MTDQFICSYCSYGDGYKKYLSPFYVLTLKIDLLVCL